MATTYVTLEAPFRFEPERTKGSRFIADLGPADTTGEALAFVDRVRQEFPDASHHCYAWSLGRDGLETRANDDGEPGGSAGRPILAQIEGHGVAGIVCVVTRYFGGTKLGVGGLMRAYGGAAGQALDRAPLVTKPITERWRIAFPYECSGVLEGLFHARGLSLLEAQYGERVEGVVVLPIADVEAFQREVQEGSGGRARLQGPL